MIRGMRTPSEHAEHGRELVRSGQIVHLREELGLTRSAMADLLHLSPMTYNRFEDPDNALRMWDSTAERLGRFAYLAELTLHELEADGIKLSELTPLHLVAMTHGMPQEVILSWYRNGDIHGVDLGVLGLWIHKDDLHMLREVG